MPWKVCLKFPSQCRQASYTHSTVCTFYLQIDGFVTNSHPNGHVVFKTPVYISDLIDTVHPCQNWRTLAWPVWEHCIGTTRDTDTRGQTCRGGENTG